MEAATTTTPKSRSEVGAVCVLIADAEYAELVERVRAATPTHCPECGSDAILPTFMDDGGEWSCENDDCLAWWTPRPGSA